jgi:hypothetical protein
MMRIIKITASIFSLALLSSLWGCGGGGGGGVAPSTVTGYVYLIGVGTPLPPNPAASVTIGGATVTTGADGSFSFPSVPSNSTKITISAAGAATLSQSLPVLTPNAANNLGNIFLTSTSAGTGYTAVATGTVVDGTTLKPITNATVQINGQVVITGSAGVFTISALPVGLGGNSTPVGQITASGYDVKPLVLDLPLGDSTPPAASNDLGNILLSNPVPGSVPGIPFDIIGTAALQGQSDASGTTVSLLDANNNTLSTTSTQQNGAWSFWVAAGQYTLRFDHVGYQTQLKTVNLSRTDQPQTVNVTLTP